MPGVFRDSPGKRVVRQSWDTPLLRHLHEVYGFTYRYFGLPGVDLLDLNLWEDMIEDVVAFEVDARGSDKRKNIEALRANLRFLGKPAVTYYGPFEFVVMQRRDWDGREYKPDRVITLYNLDFCDEICSPIDTREYGVKAWRFEALRQVLRDQEECYRTYDGPNWFLFMLTVRDQMDGPRLARFLGESPLSDTEAYRQSCEAIQPIPLDGCVLGTHTWAIKAFLHNTMRGYLTNPHVAALFFPLIRYQGTPVRTSGGLLESPMLHWIIFCQFDNPERPTPRFYPKAFLRDVATLRGEPGAGVAADLQPGESGLYQVTSPADWFRRHRQRFTLK
jgi:hypothetical protein